MDCSVLPHQKIAHPKIPWRKLSWTTTKLWNSQKFSPLKVFCYTVMYITQCKTTHDMWWLTFIFRILQRSHMEVSIACLNILCQYMYMQWYIKISSIGDLDDRPLIQPEQRRNPCYNCNDCYDNRRCACNGRASLGVYCCIWWWLFAAVGLVVILGAAASFLIMVAPHPVWHGSG